MELGVSIKARYLNIKDHLDERSLRVWVGNEALALGWGGISKVSEETGVSRNTIARGCEEIGSLPQEIITGENKRIRKEGGGRKTSIRKYFSNRTWQKTRIQIKYKDGRCRIRAGGTKLVFFRKTVRFRRNGYCRCRWYG